MAETCLFLAGEKFTDPSIMQCVGVKKTLSGATGNSPGMERFPVCVCVGVCEFGHQEFRRLTLTHTVRWRLSGLVPSAFYPV